MVAINNAIQNYDDSLEKSKQVYSGILGLAIGGSRKVNIDTRAGYVYVRLRDNLSEVIQAYNDKVSPVYNFPVLIERRGNKWYITGRDDARYETFGTTAPFLPQHGDQHSFNRDGGGGGDPVFVYPDQFMPLLVYPSGSFGAGNLLIAPYVLQRDNNYAYVGNTGTGNLLIYKPSDANAIVGLVYLDRITGNPGVLIASGTPMNGTSTGTAAVLPYVPFPSSTQEPLYAFRLVSGTTALDWNNLYNVRQFIGKGSVATGSSSGGISGVGVWDEGAPQGTGTIFNFVGDNVSVTVSGTVARVFVTGSSGSSLPPFITGSIPFSGADGILTEDNPRLWWDETNRGLRLGTKNARFNFADIFPLGITAMNQDETVSAGILVYGTGTSGAPSAGINLYRSRGSLSAQSAVRSGDIFGFIAGRGYDGANHSALARINFFATGDAITGTYAPTGIDILVAPSGSNVARSQLTIFGDSVNQPTGSTYNVGGQPHTHSFGDITSGIDSSYFSQSTGKIIRIGNQALDVVGLDCFAENGNRIFTKSTLSLTGLSLTANTFYHIYAYLNAGTPAIECVTTAPTSPYAGTARSKTGDTSRRYVGSVLVGATNTLTYWLHNPNNGYMAYMQQQDAAPYRVVANGKATTETSVSCSAVVPITSQSITIKLSNLDSGFNVFFGNSQDGITLAPGVAIYAVNVLNYPIISNFPLDSSQAFTYLYTSTPTTGLYADLYGYYFER